MSPGATIPDPETIRTNANASPVERMLVDLHGKYADLRDGNVASYIPELLKANPDWFGIALATPDGHVYEVGDTAVSFTIQSISKPFVYAAALAHTGPDTVFRKVGVEPSGDAFNAISLDPISGRPANPMINAGAIATTGLLPGETPAEMSDFMLGALSRYAGRNLAINEHVYSSEKETGFRNHAIAYMLRNAGIIESDPVGVVDVYFRQCSVEVTCRDLALMASMLAAGGVNPLSGEQVIDPRIVESMLSVMSTCGMYNFAGEWAYGVGLPAKSGVSGAILMVLPGRFGVAVFSPPLDSKGNSVRGMAVCQALSRGLDLHLFNGPVGGRSVVHRMYTGAEIHSNRVRTPRDYEALKAHGGKILVYELQGELSFGPAEIVVRDVVDTVSDARFVLVDMDRVTSINGPACTLFAGLARMLSEQHRRLILTHVKPPFSKPLSKALRDCSLPDDPLDHPWFRDIDMALEWCENTVIAEAVGNPAESEPVALENFALLAGLTSEELSLVRRTVTFLTYAGGEAIVCTGAEDRRVFLLQRGEASAMIPLRNGREKRLATFSSGMSFGEMALLGPQRRSATVYADRDVESLIIEVDLLVDVWTEHPRIRAVIMENLAADLGQKLRRTNQMVSTLGR